MESHLPAINSSNFDLTILFDLSKLCGFFFSTTIVEEPVVSFLTLYFDSQGCGQLIENQRLQPFTLDDRDLPNEQKEKGMFDHSGIVPCGSWGEKSENT